MNCTNIMIVLSLIVKMKKTRHAYINGVIFLDAEETRQVFRNLTLQKYDEFA
jgi:hypothetical protein